jgi:hypothetical protein
MTVRTNGSPEHFKQALEQRLRTSLGEGGSLARKRQLLVFDRFLARVAHVLGDSATLKGGLVLELRLARARTTKDVDLRLVGSPNDVLARLRDAGRADLVVSRVVWKFERWRILPGVKATPAPRRIAPEDMRHGETYQEPEAGET